MNVILGAIFVLLISIAGIAVVMNVGMPALEKTKAYVQVSEAESVLNLIENVMHEVITEGSGTKRIVDFRSSGDFSVISEEDAVEFKLDSPAQIFDYFSRKIVGNIIYIAGSDVSCDDTDNLVLENSFIKIVLNKTERQSPLSALDTAKNIIMVQEKSTGTTIYPANSSMLINDDPSTSAGTGYSEILRKGSNLPVCTAHFFVNSTKEYDIYYKLYAGADFISIQIKNVK